MSHTFFYSLAVFNRKIVGQWQNLNNDNLEEIVLPHSSFTKKLAPNSLELSLLNFCYQPILAVIS